PDLTRSTRLLVGPDAPGRLAAALAWLEARPADADVLVVGPSWEACDDLVRAAGLAAGARFGTVRVTLDRLAIRLAAPLLAGDGLAPATGLSLNAVAARVVHLLRADDALGYFAPVADRPGFPLAVARTLAEIRLQRVAPERLADLGAVGRDLAGLAERLAHELESAGLADRALVFETARRAADAAPPPAALLLLHVPRAAALDPSVALTSWPGEARECVEIARAVQAAAARGTPFDRMAVLLRSPGEYRPHLEEAFRRAGIPVFFARGATRPDPSGRA